MLCQPEGTKLLPGSMQRVDQHIIHYFAVVHVTAAKSTEADQNSYLPDMLLPSVTDM